MLSYIKNCLQTTMKEDGSFWKIFLIWWVVGTFFVMTAIAIALTLFEQYLGDLRGTLLRSNDPILVGLTWLIFSLLPMYFITIYITKFPKLITKKAWFNRLFPMVFSVVSGVVFFYFIMIFKWLLTMMFLQSLAKAYGWFWIWRMIWESFALF